MAHPRIQVKHLSLNRNDRPVLHDINLDIGNGEIVCLLGPSGSGKSSLLRCFNRLTEPPPQTIFLDGKDIAQIDVLALRQQVGMVFQKPALLPGTVADNITYGPTLSQRPITPADIEAILARVGLPPTFANRPVTELSGGEGQRVSLARTLANKPKVLLLDEPTAALDPTARRHIWETMLELQQDLGMTILWVTHTIEEAKQVASRMVLLMDGHIVDEGTPEHLLRPDSPHKMADFAAGYLA